MFKHHRAIAGLGLALFCAPALGQDVAKDVPPTHWAYAAVQDLAGKGLIKGYPPGGSFFGGRVVSRYEMAVIIERVLARVDELVAHREPSPQPQPAVPGVSPAQLDEVRRLVDEYHIELTVIGADLQKIKDEIGGLTQQVQTNTAEINKTKQGVAGAIDSIQEQAARIDKVSASKVDAGFGHIKFDGLLQVGFVGEANAPTRGQVDTFRIRRSELKFSGAMKPNSYWTVLIDPSKALGLNTTAAAGSLTGVSVNNASNILQDAYLGFQVNPLIALEVGQQKVPLSMEGLRSSAQLLTVERAIFNVLPVNSGRVGDIRDIGGQVRLTSKHFDGQLGVYDDGGNRQNAADDNNAKEVMVHLDYKGIPGLLLGAYQEITGGVNGAAHTPRYRFGGEFSYALGPHVLEGEYVKARDGANATKVLSEGGYLLYGYRLSPMWQFVARGEYWNPNEALTGTSHVHEFDFTLGANYYLNGNNSKIQFNYVRKNINGPVGASSTTSFLGLDRNLFLVNFQQAF